MPDYEGRYWISHEYRTKKWCGMHVAKDAALRTSVHFILPAGQPPEMVKSLNRM